MNKKKNKTIVLLCLIVVLALILFSGCFSKSDTWLNNDGYWTTEDGTFAIDIQNGYAKIVSDEDTYYFQATVGPKAIMVNVINFDPVYELSSSESVTVLSAKTSYSKKNATLTLTINNDYFFDYDGKILQMKFVPYADAPSIFFQNEDAWQQSNGDTFDFSQGRWFGTVDEIEYAACLTAFPDADAFRVEAARTAAEDWNERFATHEDFLGNFVAETIAKTDTEITLKILAADGLFADRVGETFTLTKVTEP